MPFNLNEFKSNNFGESKRGLAKQSNYEMLITLPQGIILSDKSYAASQTLRFRIESAEIPGRSIVTTDYKTTGYGLRSKIGYDVIYPEVSVTMVCGSDLGEKRLFNAWQSMIVGNHTRNQDIRKHQSVGYYQNYVSTVAIVQFDDQGNATHSTALMEAYPIITNSLPLNWGSEDLHRLTVQFAYKYFSEMDEPEAGRGAIGGGARSGLTIEGVSFGSVANALIGGTVGKFLQNTGFPALSEITGLPFFNQNSFTLG